MEAELKIVGIAAVAENGVIGSGDDMLWHISEDFRRFRQVTTGNTLIFGRRTHEQIGRILPDRRIIVITRQAGWAQDGVEVAHSIDEALALAAQTPERTCFIGGGAEIYAAAWDRLHALDITHVHESPDGAAQLPFIDPDVWSRTSVEPRDGFTFAQYERVGR